MNQATSPTLPPVPSSRQPSRAIDVFLRYLKAEGVSVVFGIPGGLLHPFFEVIESDPEIRLVVTKHEEGAAFMADGYARISRRLSVCAGTAGPGATNLLTGVACAFADGVPMLVVTGQAASHALGKGAAQETSREDMDIVAMFRPITKYSAMVTSPESLARHLRRALRLALTGRPGPAHLNVPVDLWERPLTEEWFNPKTYRPDTRTFDRVSVKRAAAILMAAKHPVLFAGAGVGIGGAEEHLRTLAELLPARVATTPRGKGLFPENHPLSLGVMGFAGHAVAREIMLGHELDVLFTVGTSLNETATLNWTPSLRKNRSFIQLDIDADRIGRNYPVDVALVGDAQAILVEVVYHIHRALREGVKPESLWRAHEPVSHTYISPELRESTQIPLTPQRWRRELEEVLPNDAIVFSDVGGHMLSNVQYLTIKERQKFILNLGFGSMGHGTAAPIGAAFAAKNRPVFAIIGDACFTMNGMELVTAAEYDARVIWIVENNNMHGITYHGSKLVGSQVPLASVRYRRTLEVAAIARAMGLFAWVVDTPNTLGDVVREALRMPGPSLIEVRVDGSIPPPLGDRARTIAGFVES
ncbi:MAG: thiamine pyrophosphate-binding protein [Polyangiaceae bacterium]|nr:thiamine pyrophosphate-binding protein [Polyangiaceae bacterium]